MKNNLYLLTLLILSLCACQNAVRNPPVASEETPDSIPQPSLPLLEPLRVSPSLVYNNLGDLRAYWVGPFEQDGEVREKKYTDHWDYSNKINLSIDSFNGDSVIGHSVVAGIRRPFRGSYREEGGVCLFRAYEPGDHPHDGVFEFRIALQDSLIKGTWKAYGDVEFPARVFTLKKRFFAYNPEAAISNVYRDWDKSKTEKALFVYEDGEEEITEEYMETYFLSTTEAVFELNPSTMLLEKEQVENLSRADIFILRNSIYARHGYSFRKRPLRVYFDNHPWYIPVYTDIKSMLTPLEKKNIKLLLSYEKHAEAYYDAYGR